MRGEVSIFIINYLSVIASESDSASRHSLDWKFQPPPPRGFWGRLAGGRSSRKGNFSGLVVAGRCPGVIRPAAEKNNHVPARVACGQTAGNNEQKVLMPQPALAKIGTCLVSPKTNFPSLAQR